MDTLKYLSVALAAILLAACAAEPPARPDAGVDTRGLESRAEQQAAAGNNAAAAALYAELAAASSGTTRAGYLLEAARLEIEAGRPAQAAARLDEVGQSGDAGQRNLATALLARVDVEQGRPQAALDRVGRLPAAADLELLRVVSAVRGRALFALGRVVDAIREIAEREIWLERPDDILANQRLIWQGLENLPPGEPPAPTGDSLVDGWLALIPVAHTEPGSADFRIELLQWRSVYNDHPAAGGLLAELVSRQRGMAEAPEHVALLLPLGSSQRRAAVAVRNGFIAGHFAAGATAAVRVYDTAALGAAEAYQQAQLEGADFIVGPLLPQDVDVVLEQSGFVPTLALNFSDNEAPFLSSFYQFGLSYEDEASAIAQRGIAEGARTAVAFVESDPRSDWGSRLLAAFRAEFEALGGELLEYSGYDPAATDYSAQIMTVLNLDDSEARHRRLAANLGRPVAFEPRRRQDVDLILLAADAAAGRLLVPQLRFHSAGDIPIYAPRDIYEPSRDRRDTDLNGVRFPDAPLLLSPSREASELRQTVEAFWPSSGPQWVRFYGLGYDAYEIMTALYGGGGSGGGEAWPIGGVTGTLMLDGQGKIRRALPFGEFRNGEPAALEILPAPAEAGEALSRR